MRDVKLEAEFFPKWLKCIEYVKICKKKWRLQEYICESLSSIILIQFFQTKTSVIYVKIPKTLFQKFRVSGLDFRLVVHLFITVWDW